MSNRLVAVWGCKLLSVKRCSAIAEADSSGIAPLPGRPMLAGSRAPHSSSAGLWTPRAPAVQDVGVDHRRAHVAVAQELLDGADVVACAQQLGREGVSKRVRRRRFDDPRESNRLAHLLLDDGFVQVMPVADAGVAVGVVGGGWEDVLPRPLPVGVW